MPSNRLLAAAAAAAIASAAAAQSPAPAGDGSGGEKARNVRLVGSNDLQGRSAYQPILHSQGGRRYLYVGHHAGRALNPVTGKDEANGTSIVDVTDPRHPILVNHIPSTPTDWPPGGDEFEKTGTQHVQVCDGDDLPGGRKGHVYLLRNQGNADNEILDVTEPRKPRRIASLGRMYVTGRADYPIRNHKNLWECRTGIAYTPASMKGWASIKSMRIYDLGNPEKPRLIREFGLPGTEPGAPQTTSRGGPEGVHEASIYRNRVVITYGSFDHGVLQILDREKLLRGDPTSKDPFAPTPENLRYPVIAELDMPDYWGAHTAKPLLRVRIPDYQGEPQGSVRDFLIVNSEGANYQCSQSRHQVWMVDITDEKHPFPVSNYEVMRQQDGFDYCRRPGTFGPHAPNASHAWSDRLIAVAYFNAGTRVVDVRNPFRPAEVGFFIPLPNRHTTDGLAPPTHKLVAGTGERAPDDRADEIRAKQPKRPYGVKTNNVEVDDRGYIYSVDRNWTGLHILELTGDAAEIARAPSPDAPAPPTQSKE